MPNCVGWNRTRREPSGSSGKVALLNIGQFSAASNHIPGLLGKKKKMNLTLYTIQRCKKDDTLYGPIHGSDNGETTLCGQDVDTNWWILNNTFDGIITCKKCLKILTKYPTLSQRIIYRQR